MCLTAGLVLHASLKLKTDPLGLLWAVLVKKRFLKSKRVRLSDFTLADDTYIFQGRFNLHLAGSFATALSWLTV